MEREDLRRVGPLWLQLSEDVRFDPKVGGLRGWREGGGVARLQLWWWRGSCTCACTEHQRSWKSGVCGRVGAPHHRRRRRRAPQAWNLTGDHYAREGERPWIAEMYGYSFGCSRAGVWHRVHTTAMLYPGYEVGLEHFQGEADEAARRAARGRR